MNPHNFVRRFGAILFVLVFSASQLGAQAPKPKTSTASAQNGDKQGELQLAAARTNPLQLRQFLKKMPKGADLHYHLTASRWYLTCGPPCSCYWERWPSCCSLPAPTWPTSCSPGPWAGARSWPFAPPWALAAPASCAACWRKRCCWLQLGEPWDCWWPTL